MLSLIHISRFQRIAGIQFKTGMAVSGDELDFPPFLRAVKIESALSALRTKAEIQRRDISVLPVTETEPAAMTG